VVVNKTIPFVAGRRLLADAVDGIQLQSSDAAGDGAGDRPSVVDDAIVVVENIHRHLEEGKSPVQALAAGARVKSSGR